MAVCYKFSRINKSVLLRNVTSYSFARCEIHSARQTQRQARKIFSKHATVLQTAAGISRLSLFIEIGRAFARQNSSPD